MKQIVGAGLAGLIAAHAWPSAQVFEAAAAPSSTHKALLRFRSNAVAALTGVDFRQVLVRKGIFYRGKFCGPNIALANAYAQKCMGYERLVGDRSIWAIEPVRFIAPEDFHEHLAAACRGRVEYAAPFDYVRNTAPVVSTAPMPVVLKALSIEAPVEFARSGITVKRWRLENTDVFQTVYFPDPEYNLYRASITGDVMIAEYAGEPDERPEELLEKAFGVSMGAFAEYLGGTEQKYGKIVNIPDPVRKQLLFELTHEHKVYSLGRFATYRNILMDDVVADIHVVKRLLKSGKYALRHATQ